MVWQRCKLRWCTVAGGVIGDDVARIARLPEAAGLRLSQTRRAALREAAKLMTQVRSTR